MVSSCIEVEPGDEHDICIGCFNEQNLDVDAVDQCNTRLNQQVNIPARYHIQFVFLTHTRFVSV